MKQWTGSKLGMDYHKIVCCHPACLIYIQSTLCELWAGWVTSWNQDFWEKYQQPQICRWYHSNGRKWRGTEEPLDEGERGEWKAGLKLSIQKWRSWHLVPLLHGKLMGKNWKQGQVLFWGAPKLLWMMTAGIKLKDICSLEGKTWET